MTGNEYLQVLEQRTGGSEDAKRLMQDIKQYLDTMRELGIPDGEAMSDFGDPSMFDPAYESYAQLRKDIITPPADSKFWNVKLNDLKKHNYDDPIDTRSFFLEVVRSGTINFSKVTAEQLANITVHTSCKINFNSEFSAHDLNINVSTTGGLIFNYIRNTNYIYANVHAGKVTMKIVTPFDKTLTQPAFIKLNLNNCGIVDITLPANEKIYFSNTSTKVKIDNKATEVKSADGGICTVHVVGNSGARCKIHY